MTPFEEVVEDVDGLVVVVAFLSFWLLFEHNDNEDTDEPHDETEDETAEFKLVSFVSLAFLVESGDVDAKRPVLTGLYGEYLLNEFEIGLESDWLPMYDDGEVFEADVFSAVYAGRGAALICKLV